MDNTWSHVAGLFEAARALPAAGREAWVRSTCADAQVAAEVIALLVIADGYFPFPIERRGTPSSASFWTIISPAVAALTCLSMKRILPSTPM